MREKAVKQAKGDPNVQEIPIKLLQKYGFSFIYGTE